MIDQVRSLKTKTDAFEAEARQILARLETSPDRVVTLDETRKHIVGLSLQQNELFEEALACIERGIHRAAHVMAWAAFIDALQQKLASDGLVKVRSLKPGWRTYGTVEELRDNVPEFQLINAARDVKLISKSEAKIIHGQLARRNGCAHPSNYRPTMNESIGYVAELLNRIEQLLPKSL